MKAIIFLCCLFLMTPFGFAQKDKKTSTTETVEKEIRQREELGTTKSVRGDSNWDGLWADGAHGNRDRNRRKETIFIQFEIYERLEKVR